MQVLVVREVIILEGPGRGWGTEQGQWESPKPSSLARAKDKGSVCKRNGKSQLFPQQVFVASLPCARLCFQRER